MTVASDEIYEKYLQKAITESNTLGDELAQAAGGARVPVLGSGHPLADVFLLKYAPQASELQEGVAFYGRAGNALLKSLQRLHVDPMAIYGTNCLKFAGGDEEESRPFLLRELHIVQPKLVVAMGGPPPPSSTRPGSRSHASSRRSRASSRSFTPTIQGLVTPDIDQSLDEQPAKTAFWNAFKVLGDVVERDASVLIRVAAFVVLAAAVVDVGRRRAASRRGRALAERGHRRGGGDARDARPHLPRASPVVVALDPRGSRSLRARRGTDVEGGPPPRLELREARRATRARAGRLCGSSSSSAGWS